MKGSTTAVRPAESSARAERREARHWIERQLRWERTLGALREQRAPELETERAA